MEHLESTAQVGMLVLQLSIILVAAKIGAELFERWLRQPAVLGELVAGIVISPYALGGLQLPFFGAIFPLPAPDVAVPVTATLYSYAQVSALILLFIAGLETEFGRFLKFGPAAIAVAVGGVCVPFVGGIWATAAAGISESPYAPSALFVGAILTATSVGITARVLGDIRKLDTPEGVTILGAAVIDDVLGILVLATVSTVAVTTGPVSMVEIGIIGGKALVAWIALTAGLAFGALAIAKIIGGFRSAGAALALAMGLAFFAAFIAQFTGLALIIGAYSAGLALSRSPIRDVLAVQLRPVHHLLVPVFFVVMGMMVDFGAMRPLLGFGALVTVIAVATKFFGCALPALAVGFSPLGGVRIGIGMLPRGEVALIIAGIGVTSGVISRDIYGVSILVTMVTTVVAPILLVPAFQRGGPGHRRTIEQMPVEQTKVELPHSDDASDRDGIVLPNGVADVFEQHLLACLTTDGYQTVLELTDPSGPSVRELARGDEVVSWRTTDLGDRRLIQLEAESESFRDVLAQAVRSATTETMATIENTLAMSGRGTLQSEMTAAVRAVRAYPNRRG